MFASIISRDYLSYPKGDDGYSPSKRYPEYPFQHIAAEENPVYDAVRETFIQVGLDSDRIGTPLWNPLGEFIRRGDKVFVLCNFVYHRRHQETEHNFFGKCTHASVIRALIDYVYLATGPNGIISFGNAPLQSCVWDRVLKDTGATELLDFYRQNGVAVAAKDLRLTVNERNILGNITVSKEADPGGAMVVELSSSSQLDAWYSRGEDVKLRVSDYNPDRVDNFHGRGKHTYVISNEILFSDVVVSVPKLKTHEKVGITVGLKGYVGCVGHKDCLAHHRFGPPKLSGDEYPNSGGWQVFLSKFHDFVYRRRYPKRLGPLLEVVDKNARRVARKILKEIQSGAWHGNDTTWRMTIDLARIMHFADRRGTMKGEPQRRHLVLVDGVIGGEGDGPLSPTPVDSKVLVFSDNVACGDLICCRLMGYPSAKIPLVHHALCSSDLVKEPLSALTCVVNGRRTTVDTIPMVLNRKFLPPVGWRGYL